MQQLQAKRREPSYAFPSDLERLQRILREQEQEASLTELQRAWVGYSASQGANWIAMHLFSDAQLRVILAEHMEPKP